MSHWPPFGRRLDRLHYGGMDDRVTYLGYTNSRANFRRFGIKERDRFSHVHILGKTGTGKSTLMGQMIMQDVRAGHASVILIDPHGDLAESLRDQLADDSRVRFLDGANPDFSFNPLRNVPRSRHSLAVAALVSVFARQWEDSWGPRVEHVLRNCLYVLVARGEATLEDLPRLLRDRALQRSWLKRVDNPPVRDFFLQEWPSYSLALRGAMQAPLLNKLGAYLSDDRLRAILTETANPLRLSDVMARREILLVSLAKGEMGPDPAHLLGSLLLAYTALGGLARDDSTPAFVFVDELGSVATPFVGSMLEELRKRQVGVTVAHQHLSQLGRELGDAVLGNAGTQVAFRSGSGDAAVLAREFAPRFDAEDFLSLPNFRYYLRLMIDGRPGRAFSASGLAATRNHDPEADEIGRSPRNTSQSQR